MHFGKARQAVMIEYRRKKLGGGQGNQLGNYCNYSGKTHGPKETHAHQDEGEGLRQEL